MTLPVSAAASGCGLRPAMIAAIVLTSTTGEVLTAAAMKSIGDLDDIRAKIRHEGRDPGGRDVPAVFCGVFFLALAFFSLLFALNHLNLSLVAPASASLTLVTNAMAGKFFCMRMWTGGDGLRRCWCALVFIFWRIEQTAFRFSDPG